MIKLILIVEKPPAGVVYALQKGKGSEYEVVQKQTSRPGSDPRFEFEIPATLTGPFVQGPKDGRFVYIDIGTYAHEPASEWARRIKVPLAGIDAVDGTSWQASIPGTAKDGTPACATVKPTAGWKRVILTACSIVAVSSTLLLHFRS
jgi:hypothetical protein